jgi:hypothetical protein
MLSLLPTVIDVRVSVGCTWKLGQNSPMSSQTKMKKMYINVCKEAVFEVQLPYLLDFNHLDFYLWDTKNSTILSSNWKWRDTSPMHFLCLSNHSQLLWDPRKSVDSPWLDMSVHALIRRRRRTFWAFVMNCDLINNTNLAVNWECVLLLNVVLDTQKPLISGLMFIWT